MGILKFQQTPTVGFLTLFSMTWRNSVRKRYGAMAIAVAMCGVVPAGSVWADEPVDESAPGTPADGDDDASTEPVDEPTTGEVDGVTVAVGLAPVPPTNDQPQVAVGLAPVPPTNDQPQVAVGLPPMPPVTDQPQVSVGRPPVPPAGNRPHVAVGQPPVPPAALFETVSAALDFVADCL